MPDDALRIVASGEKEEALLLIVLSLLRLKRFDGRFKFIHRLPRVPHALKVCVEFSGGDRVADHEKIVVL